MDIITPTRERLRHAEDYDAPQVDQRTQRRAYRVLDEFQRLAKADEIDASQYQAAYKWQRHWWGAQGIDVSDGTGGYDEASEYPISYHGQVLAKAKRELSVAQWITMANLTNESGSLDHIGRILKGYADRRQARAYGLAVVHGALDRLAVHWGLAARPG